MRIWNYGEALDVVKDEFDLVNETFITEDEYVGYFNRGIQKAAADIYKLGVEDEYFQDELLLAMVAGASDIDLPPKIYANKIREIIYSDGLEIYEIRRIRRRNKYLKIAEINQFAKESRYSYTIKNASSLQGPKIVLIPPSRITSNTVATAHYLREAEFIPLVSAGSLVLSRAALIDLPECMNYIFAYVMWRIAQKIPHPNLANYEKDRDEERVLMVETLTGQVDDDNTEVEPDTSHYRESS